MKNALALKFLTALFCTLVVCSMVTAQETPPVTTVTAPVAGATISDFKGKVSIQLPGQALLSPSRGQVLPPESTVTTDDGRLLLRLSDGSDILVRPHTRVIIKEPESSGWRYLQLLVGRIRSQIQKHLGGSPAFQIGTPSAVISVRGTRFDVEVNRLGFTEVDVDEGIVELDSLSGRGESVIITAGFSSRVGMDSAPEVPRPTREFRPQLDRPSTKKDRDPGDDDAIRRLESDRGHGDRSGGISGGGDSSGSDGGDHSGSSGSGSSGSSGSGGDRSGSSGSDDGSSVSGTSGSGSSGSSGSDGGDHSGSSGSGTSGSSGSDGGDRSGTSGSGSSGSGSSGSGDKSGSGDRHGGRPPGLD